MLDQFILQGLSITPVSGGDICGKCEEELPPNMPEPLGRTVQATMFVDADHAGNKVTRRSRTGILIFLMSAPVMWYSKQQNSMETSSFGSEFSALKTGTEMDKGLRYKLRMMGVPLDGPTHVRVTILLHLNLL
jgi:hypothetical protein